MNNKWCVTAAIIVSVLHILTVAATDHQIEDLYGPQKFDHFFFVNHAIFLAPIAVLLLARRSCILIGVFGIPVVILFVLRMHHLWELSRFGINSMQQHKGDSAGWFQILFAMLAVIATGLVLIGFLVSLLVSILFGGRKPDLRASTPDGQPQDLVAPLD